MFENGKKKELKAFLRINTGRSAARKGLELKGSIY
jgi:hypothetical protein